MMQRVFTGTHDYGHLVVEYCSETALSDGNSHDRTACYLPVSKFQTSFLGQTCYGDLLSADAAFYTV